MIPIDDFDATLLDIAAIQGELHYKQAQDALRNLVQHLDLTPQEQQGLETELTHLSQTLDKLDHSVVQIAAFGMVGRGKSSVLNALLGENAFAVGPLHGVTRTIGNANWQVQTDDLQVQRLALPAAQNAQIQLIDTPGIDEIDGKTREQLAQQVAKQADLILFVVSGDMTQVEYNALAQLRDVGKPMLLVFNKIDQYPEADRLAIYHTICNQRVRELISPDEVVMVAAAPLVAVQVERGGKVTLERQRGAAQIIPLKLKILDLLHREGKSLLALNTMLYATEINEQVVQRKLAIRREGAESLTQRAVMAKALAIALNPVTVLDLLTGATIDVALILSLGKLYGLTMTQGAAIALLRQIAWGMGGITLTDLLTTLGFSGMKTLLGVTAPLTGGASLLPYVSVAIAQGAVAGVMTTAIARITQTYLANGATWGPEGPKTVIQNILTSLDEQSILHRIKAELTAKLTAQPLPITTRPPWDRDQYETL